MRRKHLFLIGTVITGIAGVLFLLPLLVDVNRYRPLVETNLEQWLGREVTLGQMRLSLIPLGFHAKDAVISEDPSFQTGRYFAEAENLYVHPRFLSLIRGKLGLGRLKLSKPKVEFVRNKEGHWNFSTIGNGGEPNILPDVLDRIFGDIIRRPDTSQQP
jgi:uncharacterized protein involved in outer membrane biogenesis